MIDLIKNKCDINNFMKIYSFTKQAMISYKNERKRKQKE